MEPLTSQYLDHDSCLMFSFTIQPSTRHLGHPDRTGIHRCILARSLLGHNRAAVAAAAEGSRRIHRKTAEVAGHEVPHSPVDELWGTHRGRLAGSLLVAAHRSQAAGSLHILERESL